MTANPAVTVLGTGAFFGSARRSITTPSFLFSKLQATVPERKVPRHTHDSPHFILVTSGLYRTEARNQKGICSAGTLIFNPGGTTHRDCFRSDRGEFLSISPGLGPSNLLEKASSVPLIIGGPAFRMDRDPWVGDRIVTEFHDSTDSSAMVLESLGLELVGLLSERVRSASTFIPTWLFETRDMIEDCFASELTVAELAVTAGVHPVYLARAYRRHFGCSPGEYMRRCRLMRAQRLLANPDLPLVEVALRTGFSDQSQMTKSFTAMFGISPGRYRRLRRS